MVTINGEKTNIQGISLLQYLLQADYNPDLIAIERNFEIINKENYATTIINDGDEIEIVSFMGGGQ